MSEQDWINAPSPALFLDRDGVINVDHGYVHRVSDFEFVDGIFELARSARALGFKIVVITNQAGIARGYYSEADFHQLSDWMCGQFLERNAPIARVYFSPYHPIEGLGIYKKDDFSRKPHPGMILRAQQELALDLKKSLLIGDKASDLEAGVAAGVGCNILFSKLAGVESVTQADYQITALNQALPILHSLAASVGTL